MLSTKAKFYFLIFFKMKVVFFFLRFYLFT